MLFSTNIQCADKRIACVVLYCVADLVEYNDEVRMEAVHRNSIANNNGVQGRNLWTLFLVYIIWAS